MLVFEQSLRQEEAPRRFVGRAHPGRTSRRWAFARAFVRPLAVCTLPVMVGALVAVLQAFPALIFLTVGFPVAVATAAAWTLFRMQATFAEIYVQPGAAALRTVWECLRRDRTLAWRPILELRATAATLTLGLGDATYDLDRADWPDADSLLEALRDARDAGSPLPFRPT